MTQIVPWCMAGHKAQYFWHCQARLIMRNASTTYTFIKAIEGVQGMTCRYIGLLDPLNNNVFDYVNLHHDYWTILNNFSTHKGAYHLYHIFILGCYDHYKDMHQLNQAMAYRQVCVEHHALIDLPGDMSMMYFDPLRKFFFRECASTTEVQYALRSKSFVGVDAHVSVIEFADSMEVEKFGPTYKLAMELLAEEMPRSGHFFVYIKQINC